MRAQSDGKYHKLKLTRKAHHRNVSTRAGYYAK
jgi:hypothetical protein